MTLHFVSKRVIHFLRNTIFCPGRLPSYSSCNQSLVQTKGAQLCPILSQENYRNIVDIILHLKYQAYRRLRVSQTIDIVLSCEGDSDINEWRTNIHSRLCQYLDSANEEINTMTSTCTLTWTYLSPNSRHNKLSSNHDSRYK